MEQRLVTVRMSSRYKKLIQTMSDSLRSKQSFVTYFDCSHHLSLLPGSRIQLIMLFTHNNAIDTPRCHKEGIR